MKEEKAKTVTGSSAATFNIIAMRDIKDKTTRKGSLRPLFDCVDSFAAAVDSLHDYLASDPEDGDAEVVSGFISGLTNMQVKLLDLCKQKIQTENVFKPEEAALPEEVGTEKITKDQAVPLPAKTISAPVAKTPAMKR